MPCNLITTDHLVFGIRHHFSLSMLLVPTRPPSVVHLHPILDLDGEHPISISLAFTHLSATTRGHQELRGQDALGRWSKNVHVQSEKWAAKQCPRRGR